MSRIATVRHERERADEQERHDRWFAGHVAERFTFTDPAERVIDMLTWRKPGTGCYRVDYLATGGRLMVTGDLGDAIYAAWPGKHPNGGTLLDFWGSLSDRCYFRSKCVASEHGRIPHEWDSERARLRMREHFARMRLEAWGLSDDGAKVAEQIRDFALYEGWEAVQEGEGAWLEWLRQHAYDIIGDHDWWEWAPNIGHVIPFGTRAHLEGLRRALAQLAASRESAELAGATS